MNRFDAPDSIFAPIIAAVPPGTKWAGFGNSALAAVGAVPIAEAPYWVRPGRFKRNYETRQRKLLSMIGENAKPFTVRVRLHDRVAGENGPVHLAETHWDVGITQLKKGLCAPAVPEDYDAAILQTSVLRYSSTGITGAPQLALFRHLWAHSVLAATPDAIVFGGQSHWRDDWWTETISAAAEG